VETVDYILKKYMKDLELYFILGQDAFHAIQSWKDWQRLLLLCNFVVMTRPGYVDRGLEGILPADFASQFKYDDSVKGLRGPTGHAIYFRGVTFLDISSSDIRQRARESRSIKYLVPETVRHYIMKNSLYRNIK
jgi:nicotinate-nucleotide adenylyltransferase